MVCKISKKKKKIILYSIPKLKDIAVRWVSVSSTGKVSDGWIKDLGFDPPTYTKNQLMFWSDDKKLLSETDVTD